MEFIAERVARPAASISARASALDHELRDNSMKHQAVVISFFLFLSGSFVDKFLRALGQADEILDRFGRFFLEQSYHDISLRSFKNGVSSCGSAHSFSLRAATSYMSRRTPRQLAPPYQPLFFRSSVMCAAWCRPCHSYRKS